MRNNRGDIVGLAIALLLATLMAIASTPSYGESMSPEAQAELAEVARKAIADEIYHYCVWNVPDYAATEDWNNYCRKAGKAEAALLDDPTAIAEFKRMIALWAEAAGN